MERSQARVAAGLFFVLAVMLAGCASIAPQTYALRSSPPPGLPTRVELNDVPFFPQEDYQCGPAALATVLNFSGTRITPEALAEQVYLPGRKGSLQVEMVAAVRRNGMLVYELAPEFADVLTEVAAGNPVVVLENYGVSFYPLWHFAVVVGYDLDSGEVVLRSGTTRRQTLPFAVFEHVWRPGQHWAMLALPPGRLPATATESRYLSAALALEKSGQIRAAKTAYAGLLRRWPDSFAGRMGLGNAAYALKELREAEQAFRKAALDHGESAPALNNLAQTLADQGRIGEALEAAHQAVKLGGEWSSTSQATLETIEQKARRARR